MASRNSTPELKNLLSQFIGESDPLLTMLKWLTEKHMLLEAEQKAGTKKGSHSRYLATHFSGNRVRRFNTPLGMMYLVVPKLRKDGYIPFFITEKSVLSRPSCRCSRGVYQWSLNPQDRSAYAEAWHQKHLCKSDL